MQARLFGAVVSIRNVAVPEITKLAPRRRGAKIALLDDVNAMAEFVGALRRHFVAGKMQSRSIGNPIFPRTVASSTRPGLVGDIRG
jgi:hypothetical protein